MGYCCERERCAGETSGILSGVTALHSVCIFSTLCFGKYFGGLSGALAWGVFFVLFFEKHGFLCEDKFFSSEDCIFPVEHFSEKLFNGVIKFLLKIAV